MVRCTTSSLFRLLLVVCLATLISPDLHAAPRAKKKNARRRRPAPPPIQLNIPIPTLSIAPAPQMRRPQPQAEVPQRRFTPTFESDPAPIQLPSIPAPPVMPPGGSLSGGGSKGGGPSGGGSPKRPSSGGGSEAPQTRPTYPPEYAAESGDDGAALSEFSNSRDELPTENARAEENFKPPKSKQQLVTDESIFGENNFQEGEGKEELPPNPPPPPRESSRLKEWLSSTTAKVSEWAAGIKHSVEELTEKADSYRKTIEEEAAKARTAAQEKDYEEALAARAAAEKERVRIEAEKQRIEEERLAQEKAEKERLAEQIRRAQIEKLAKEKATREAEAERLKKAEEEGQAAIAKANRERAEISRLLSENRYVYPQDAEAHVKGLPPPVLKLSGEGIFTVSEEGRVDDGIRTILSSRYGNIGYFDNFEGTKGFAIINSGRTQAVRFGPEEVATFPEKQFVSVLRAVCSSFQDGYNHDHIKGVLRSILARSSAEQREQCLEYLNVSTGRKENFVSEYDRAVARMLEGWPNDLVSRWYEKLGKIQEKEFTVIGKKKKLRVYPNAEGIAFDPDLGTVFHIEKDSAHPTGFGYESSWNKPKKVASILSLYSQLSKKERDKVGWQSVTGYFAKAVPHVSDDVKEKLMEAIARRVADLRQTELSQATELNKTENPSEVAQSGAKLLAGKGSWKSFHAVREILPEKMRPELDRRVSEALESENPLANPCAKICDIWSRFDEWSAFTKVGGGQYAEADFNFAIASIHMAAAAASKDHCPHIISQAFLDKLAKKWMDTGAFQLFNGAVPEKQGDHRNPFQLYGLRMTLMLIDEAKRKPELNRYIGKLNRDAIDLRMAEQLKDESRVKWSWGSGLNWFTYSFAFSGLNLGPYEKVSYVTYDREWLKKGYGQEVKVTGTLMDRYYDRLALSQLRTGELSTGYDISKEWAASQKSGAGDSAARLIPSYLSLVRHEPTQDNVNKLYESMMIFRDKFGPLSMISTGQGAHNGPDGMAPYYLLPSLPFTAAAIRFLKDNPSLLNEAQRKEMKNYEMDFFKKVGGILIENGDFLSPNDEGMWGDNPRTWANALGVIGLLPIVDKCDNKTIDKKRFTTGILPSSNRASGQPFSEQFATIASPHALPDTGSGLKSRAGGAVPNLAH